MVVLGDGRVSSCEMLEPIGNVRDQDWDEILQSDAFKRQVGDIEAGKCYCTHNCAMFDSIFFSPVNSSKLLHQTID
jgi:MoaA/NifB/PqqE/SkfB family radical SAM enzyme